MLNIELSLDEEIDQLPFEFQRTVLRITQEALANAHRHAAATRVDLSIVIDDRDLHLRVSDNGKGMPQASRGDVEGTSGVGIAGMKARVAEFGGTINFPSGPNGTTVIARIPLPDSGGLMPELAFGLEPDHRERTSIMDDRDDPRAL
jgi:signal transduction histidine kinase